MGLSLVRPRPLARREAATVLVVDDAPVDVAQVLEDVAGRHVRPAEVVDVGRVEVCAATTTRRKRGVCGVSHACSAGHAVYEV